ncbi:NACHT domain-containing protein [Phytohabitans rumicis]|uniref:NACHT domain-containing protein n=1 Tax=Phytohabitans rumicis TaxID=1076125 RepID=UPI00156693C2|nr:NACHT domain-containing protein [Phytohabitans rumicis]
MEKLTNLLKGTNLDLAELLVALASLVVAVGVAVKISARLRRLLSHLWRSLLYTTGSFDRRYQKWFVREYAKTENIYLNQVETLDLASTYVPLTVTSDEGQSNAELLGTDVLGSGRNRLIILGDPGSGKSTLLRAYAVGITKRTWRTLLLGADRRPRGKEVPFLIPLRRLRPETGSNAIERQMRRILVNAGITRASEWYLRRLLKDRRCLILLDGLDEIARDRYRWVVESVGSFINGDDTALPTANGRMALTCRHQNFLKLRDDWMPWFSEEAFTLAPFRDEDMQRYVTKRRSAFRKPKSSAKFIADLRASGNFDLYRSPLILAMSVGLYAREPDFVIPSSVPVLYDSMISEMLRRRASDSSPVSQSLKFQAKDKRRVLREVAFASTVSSDQFESFTRRALVDHTDFLAPELTSVARNQVDDFVDEIVSKAGLVFEASEDGLLAFSHRSIHEFFVAEQLLRMEEESLPLIGEKAAHDAWRQSLMFVAAGAQNTDKVLLQIFGSSPELAGYALAGARASKRVADEILETLADQVASAGQATVLVPALLAATRSPEVETRDTAIQLIKGLLEVSSQKDLVAMFGGDIYGVLQVLGDVANSNSPRVVALASTLMTAVPNNRRLVGPLWRCLNTYGIEDEPECKLFVSRLLNLAMDSRYFTELQNQPSLGTLEFGRGVREEAYPFKRGVPITSNLVTLLCLADALSVEPLGSNGSPFLIAKRANLKAFKKLERDKRFSLRIPITIPQWFLVALGTIASLGAVTWLALTLYASPRTLSKSYETYDFGLLVLAIIIGSIPYQIVKVEQAPPEQGTRRYELGCFTVIFYPVPRWPSPLLSRSWSDRWCWGLFSQPPPISCSFSFRWPELHL